MSDLYIYFNYRTLSLKGTFTLFRLRLQFNPTYLQMSTSPQCTFIKPSPSMVFYTLFYRTNISDCDLVGCNLMTYVFANSYGQRVQNNWYKSLILMYRGIITNSLLIPISKFCICIRRTFRLQRFITDARIKNVQNTKLCSYQEQTFLNVLLNTASLIYS